MLGEPPNGIPIRRDFADALAYAGAKPDYFIFGTAPASGRLSSRDGRILPETIDLGMNIVDGLHEFLSDSDMLSSACMRRRRPPKER